MVCVYQFIKLTHLLAGNQSVYSDFQVISEIYRIILKYKQRYNNLTKICFQLQTVEMDVEDQVLF